MGELVDGDLHPRAHRKTGLPIGRLLFGATADLQVAEFPRGKADVPGGFTGGGAPSADRAGLTLPLVNRATTSGAAVGEEGRVGAMPSLADRALRAGHLSAVDVDEEVVPAEALVLAVLAGGVARQRPGDRDLVLLGAPFHVDQGGVATVDQVLGGQQLAVPQPGVDAGQGLGVLGGGRSGGHICDHVGPISGADLSEVRDKSLPAGYMPATGLAGRQVVGGDDRDRRGRQSAASSVCQRRRSAASRSKLCGTSSCRTTLPVVLILVLGRVGYWPGRTGRP